MLKPYPFNGSALRGQEQNIATLSRGTWDWSGTAKGNGVLISSNATSASNGRVRVGFNVDAEAATVSANAYPSAEPTDQIMLPIFDEHPVLLPFAGREGLEKVTIYNPSGGAIDFAVTLLKMLEGFDMTNLTPVVATSITLTDGVASTIDWSTLADNGYGDLVTIATHDGSGTNAVRVVHNGDGSPPATTTDGPGAVTDVFSYHSAPIPHDANIDTTDLRQDSGGNLTVYLTKWKRVAA